MPDLLLKLSLSAYAFGIVAGLAAARRDELARLAGAGAGLAAGTCGVAAALSELIGAPGKRVAFNLWPSLLPHLRLGVRLDPLGAYFLLIVSALAIALSLYSFGYVRGFCGRKSVGALAAFFNGLLLTTTLVFLASNAFFFLIAWELMALTAYCLVSFEHETKESRNAGVLLFIMSHLGTGCLIAGFLLLFQASGSYEFESFRRLGVHLSAGRRDAAFLLFLVGFGVKAGIIPLHIWLPAAHPVAPSHASALLSGVLIKAGIYGLTRVLFEFLGTPPNWWGVTLLSIGTVSALLGVLYALMEHDLKRLLAYHSIENIGIILMGLGAALMFLHTHHPILATFALIASLYHTLNHAIFKALLFLGAGAVVHATHTRNMEEMGGLIKRMPKTALCFLVGAVAIAALPPLNGFVSEWLTYQSLLLGFGTTSSLIRLMFPLCGAMLALTGALAAACFVKAFGITFLAQPRGEPAAQAREASPTMLAGMGLLAAACIFLGLFPLALVRLLAPLTLELTGQRLALTSGSILTNTRPLGGTVSTLGIALMGICLLPIPLGLWLVFARHSRVRIGPTWDCGLRGLTPAMEYTATGFSKPIRMIFKALFRPKREVQREYDYSPYFAKTLRFDSHIEEPFVRRLYRPLNRAVLRLSRRMRTLQAGSIHAYLIYIFVTFLVLLIFAL